MDRRREFLLKLGLPRHEAYDLAKNTDFDVNRLDQKCYEYFERGFRRQEVVNEILSKLSNYDTRTENSRKAPLMPTYFDCSEDKDREYHSQSRSRPYETTRKDRTERSFSPTQCSKTEREIYFWQQANNRDDEKRGTIYERSPFRPESPAERFRSEKYTPSPTTHVTSAADNEELYRQRTSITFSPRNDQERERFRSSRSRSPKRLIHEQYRQHNYSPPANYRKEESYKPSRSPNRVTSEELCLDISYSARRNIRREEHNVLPYTDVNERYRQHISPPMRNNRREEHYHSSGSRSPNRVDNGEEHRQYPYALPRNYRREEGIHQQYRQHSYSPPINVCREERYHSLSRSYSPNHFSSPIRERKQDEVNFRNNNFKYEIRRDSVRDHSRSFSPAKQDFRPKYYRSSRSPSPFMNFIDKIPEKYSSQQDNIFEPSPPRAYSPNRNDYISSPRKLQSARQTRMLNYTQNDPSRHKTLSAQQNKSRHNRNIPSLLTLDLFPQKRISTEVKLQNRNIPSLLDLQVFPNRNDLEQPSTSKQSNCNNTKSNKRVNQEPHDDWKNRKKFIKIEGTDITKKSIGDNKQTALRPNIAEVPIIQSGLKKPAPGHLKANPQDYWSQWWPRYKYIEYSIPNINPDDIEVKRCLFYLLDPNSPESRKRTYVLLNKGVQTIMHTMDINETNYYVRDIFKLFQYKKHLEDPNFQNTLTPEQLNCIAPALRQFQIKPTMALLHQALIVKWHVSLDIMRKVKAGQPVMSTYAKQLLNDKSFHYFVMKSIKELKKMCQQDWPQFNEFYKNLKSKKVNIREVQ